MTGALASGLYVGEVMHRRLRPRAHRLQYRMFSLLLDIDEVEALGRKLRLFATRGFSLFGFRTGDHLDGSATPLRAQVEARMARAGLTWDGGAVRVLTMPRVLGFVFNPVSVWFIHAADGGLAAVLYEVNNTFGERHEYLLPVPAEEAGKAAIRQSTAKAFHVSPFMAMDMTYDFRLGAPGERLAIGITGSDASGPLISAVHTARRRELTDRALARVFVTHPLLTLKVVGGILWEAARLWVKRVPVHNHPVPAGVRRAHRAGTS